MRKAPPTRPAPEGVGGGESQIEVEDLQLAVELRLTDGLGPSSGNLFDKDVEGDDGARQVDHQLNDVVEDDRQHSAVKRIGDGDGPDQEHSPEVGKSGDHRKHQPGGKETDPVRQGTSSQKQEGGEVSHPFPQTVGQELVGGLEPLLEVDGTSRKLTSTRPTTYPKTNWRKVKFPV